MIRLTRLNGSEFSLNPDLIHRAEETPDTVLTLIDGSRYVVVQNLEELIDRVVAYRARVVAAAGAFAPAPRDSSTEFPDPADVAGFDDDAPVVAGVVRLHARRT